LRLAPTLVAPGLVALCLAGCVTPQVYVTSLGPLMVRPEPDLVIFNPVVLPDGFEIEPTPILGGLVVRTLGGQPVPFEARDAALEALEAHCIDQAVPGVPYFFGWRAVGAQSFWSAADCIQP